MKPFYIQTYKKRDTDSLQEYPQRFFWKGGFINYRTTQGQDPKWEGKIMINGSDFFLITDECYMGGLQ